VEDHTFYVQSLNIQHENTLPPKDERARQGNRLCTYVVHFDPLMVFPVNSATLRHLPMASADAVSREPLYRPGLRAMRESKVTATTGMADEASAGSPVDMSLHKQVGRARRVSLRGTEGARRA
jgi:hypothetical protein